MDRIDIAVLSPAPAPGWLRLIGLAQASIIVGPSRRGGWHWVHPPPVLGRQRHGTHHSGGPRQRGGKGLIRKDGKIISAIVRTRKE